MDRLVHGYFLRHRKRTHHSINDLLAESIKSSVGNKVKILFKNVVRLETKGDKTENRVLVSGFCQFIATCFVIKPNILNLINQDKIKIAASCERCRAVVTKVEILQCFQYFLLSILLNSHLEPRKCKSR
jgi:hypothetical protein